MTVYDEKVGKHYGWHRERSEIEDLRTRARRPDSDYAAKVDVYEDRVKGWFLEVATSLTIGSKDPYDPLPGDYVVLAIGLSYVEGVEQFRQGEVTPDKQSGDWFKTSIRRIFPGVSEQEQKHLWKLVRNGLFHDGFTRGPTLVSREKPQAILLNADGYLYLNPAKFIEAVIVDFDSYIEELRRNPDSDLAKQFVKLWDELWNKTEPRGAGSDDKLA
jgi:hypothetical protein